MSEPLTSIEHPIGPSNGGRTSVTRNEAHLSDERVYRALATDVRFLPVVLTSAIGTLGTNVATPALPAIADTLMVSDSRIGLVVSVYSLTAMLFVPFSGILADVFGRRTVLLPSILVFGAAGAAIAFVDTFAAILVLRGVQGVAIAAIMPLSVTLLGDLYDGATGSAAQGLRAGANGFSAMVTPAIAGYAAGVAWHFPFLIYLICFPAFGLVYRYLPETTGGGTAGRGPVDVVSHYAGAIRAEVTQMDLGVLMFGGFVRDFVRYALITFSPLFAVRVLDASLAQAGLILSIRGVIIMAIGPLSGAIVAYFTRKQALAGSLLISAVTVAAVPFSPNVYILTVFVSMYTAGDALFSPVIKDTVTGLASDERRGGIVSGMNMLKYAGQTASPAVFGIVLALSGFGWLFVFAGALAAAYTVAITVTISADV